MFPVGRLHWGTRGQTWRQHGRRPHVQVQHDGWWRVGREEARQEANAMAKLHRTHATLAQFKVPTRSWTRKPAQWQSRWGSSLPRKAMCGNPERNERIWSFSIANGTSGTFDPNQTYRQVKHKVTVLLPDVDPPSEFNSAREFLRRENMITSKPMASGTEIYESIFPYGRSKINKKYRNSHQLNSNTSSSWNFILNANS